MADSTDVSKQEIPESKEDEESPAPLRMSGRQSSHLQKSPRRMSIQASISRVTLQQEEFTSSSFVGAAATGTQSLRINRRIEQSYLEEIQRARDPEKTFKLGDILENINSGMQVFVDDDFSLCFKRPERRSWNWNLYLFIFWCIGVVIRYLILFPLRLLAMTLATLLTMLQLWIWKKLFSDPQQLERWELWSLQTCFRVIVASWGAVIEYKGVIASKNLIRSLYVLRLPFHPILALNYNIYNK